MAKLFETYMGLGRFIDQASLTVPTNNGVTIEQTVAGRAAYYDGSANLDYGDRADINNNSASIAVIYRQIEQNATFRRVVDKRLGNDEGYSIDVNNSGKYRVLIEDDSTNTAFVNTTDRVDDNQFHLDIVTIDRGTDVMSLIHDNSPDDTADISGVGSLANSAVLSLGASSVGSLGMNGNIAYALVCDHVLTADEKTDLWNFYQGLIALLQDPVSNRDTVVAGLDGAGYAYKAIADYRIADTSGSVEAWIRTSSATFQEIFSSADEDTNNYAFLFRIEDTGKVRLFLKDGSIVCDIIGTQNVADGVWHLVKVESNGSANKIYIDGVEDTLSSETSNDGEWFADVSTRENLLIGALKWTIITQQFTGQKSDVIVRDGSGVIVNRWLLNENGGLTALDAIGSDDLTWTDTGDPYASSRINAILNIDGTNWNAEFITFSAGQVCGDFLISSGSFRVGEDGTGKYVECMTNGTLEFLGLDLSEFVGNGYIQRIDGDLSSNAGLTVDASALSFAGNIVSIPMTAGQLLRNLTITRDAS